MLYGTCNVATRTLFKLTAAVAVLLVCAGTASAAGSGPAPQLVPFTVTAIAGNTQSTVGGYGGDGGLGTAATLNTPNIAAMDSVGNVYYADEGNAIIREINAQTGFINTVAGVPPSRCAGTACAQINTGCADGTPATGKGATGIGSGIHGMAIDAYGNIFFTDQTTQTASVIYRGGTQIANFIKLVNPAGVATSGGSVKAGYIYHIAGTINLTTCVGSQTSSTATPPVPLNDNMLAFQGPTFNGINAIAVDAADNIYIGDQNNNYIRVINTQSTAQTFFGNYNNGTLVANSGTTVQPGYLKAAIICGAATITCPTQTGTNTATTAGIGGPVADGYFTTLAGGQGGYMSADAYGNVYMVNYKGGSPGIYAAVAYAGGATLGNMINNANAGNITGSTGGFAGVSTLKATQGDWYLLLQNVTLRPSSIYPDVAGNVYYQDNHYSEVYRVDVNATPYSADFLEYSTMFASSRNAPATTAAPVGCFYSTTAPQLTGYTTSDASGDGCPAYNAVGPTYGSTQPDSAGNLIITDQSHQTVRKVSLNNQFPATAVGNSVRQTIQVHFDQNNLPVKVGIASALTTSSFSIAPGIPDFTISPISSIYTNSAAPAVTGLPTCSNLTSSVDASVDCVVNIIFAPTAGGLRKSQLVVTTANGSVYNFSLTGIGTGGQLAIDGGAQTVITATNNALPLGPVGQVAVDTLGNLYIADPANNRVLACASGQATPCATSTTIGTGLSGPMGVAVDYANNVYISDTGNNRILKVNPITSVQTVLGANLSVTTPAQYAFSGPQGIAVDATGNVYVADTGNKVVVEIPFNPMLGGATPLLAYPGAPTFSNPVAVALDSAGNIYVADSGSRQVVEIFAGGGDLQNPPGSTLPFVGSSAPVVATPAYLRSPSGIAVDAGGNLYVSDSSNNQVFEFPLTGVPNGPPFNLNFTGTNFSGLAPATANQKAGYFAGGAIALDPSGNLYVADSGNNRVLFDNRNNPIVQFGTVPQDLSAPSVPLCNTQTYLPNTTCSLTVTNTGNAPVTLTSPFTAVTSTTPAGNTEFTLSTSLSTTCKSGASLLPGATCTISPTFQPTADGLQMESVSINGGSQSLLMAAGTGEQPLAQITLAVTAPSGGAVAGSPATVTATLTQPFITGNTPTGTVTFTYTDSCAGDTTTTGSATVTIVAGKASFTLPTLQQGRRYTVNAVYNGDSLNSVTNATPLVITIPGITGVTATAPSVTFVYGSAVPAITGTVTGLQSADVTAGLKATFSTAATSSTPIGVYPITVTFTGSNACAYGFPAVLTASGSPATVTETAAALTVAANNATAPYGAGDLNYTTTITGAQNGDVFPATFTPPNSSVLNVGTYSLVPSPIGPSVGNYNLTIVNGTLTITLAPATITVIPGVTATSGISYTLPSNLSKATLTIAVSTLVPVGKGTPSGTVTITDTFTPIIATAPGTSATAAPVTIGPLPLVAGQVVYTPTSTALGTHVYTVAYSGDSNFAATTTATSTVLEVDNADFTVTAPTTPVQVAPGVVPGGNAAVAGEAAATPEQATLSIAPILGMSGTVSLSCTPQNPSYVTCTIAPPTVTMSGTTVQTAIVSVSTPATLPLNFFGTSSALRMPASETALAFLPLGVLAFCFRKRRRLSKALWMLLAVSMVTSGLSGCGGNSVHFFTPVPAGAQSVTVYATGTSPTTQTVITRSFTIPINIQ